MGTIFIQQLSAQTTIGVHAWERCIKQKVVVDVQLTLPLDKAGVSDDCADTIDYQQVAELITRTIEQSEFQLIEALAHHIAEQLQQVFTYDSLQLTLTKPGAIPNAQAVGVVISR
jgi:dihydroneopterin aldolase